MGEFHVRFHPHLLQDLRPGRCYTIYSNIIVDQNNIKKLIRPRQASTPFKQDEEGNRIEKDRVQKSAAAPLSRQAAALKYKEKITQSKPSKPCATSPIINSPMKPGS
jgi:hypothetical protein